MGRWKETVNVFMQRKLREVKDYDDFKHFLKSVRENDFELHSKRSGRRVFGFNESYNPEYCDYAIDDGVSVGHCKWENLYRVIYVEEI